MISGLLYVIGLIAALVGVVLGGYQLAADITPLLDALKGSIDQITTALMTTALHLAPAGTIILWGLLLMGFARVIMLLGAINRSLRGSA